MKKPKVTIIIPAYNSQEYIGRCLDSVFAQAFQDYEVLVLNDGSTDETGEIVKKYARSNKQLRYVEQENIGVARTRNKALKLANGEFVAFLDNDDFIDSDYIEKLLPSKNEDVVISGYKRPDVKGKIVREVRLEKTNWSKFVVPAPWAKIYKRKYLLDNKIEFLDNNIGEDVYFNLIALLSTEKIKILRYVGYNWFFNEKSVSNTKQKRYSDINVFDLLNESYDELKRRRLLDANYEQLELFYYRYVVWFLLYAAKGAKKERIDKTYDELFGWLGERFPDYKSNRLLKGNLPGEVGSTRIIYKTFMRFHRMGLGKILVWGYAKI